MAVDLEHVREIAARVAASSGLELVDVEFRAGGKNRMLRVFVDKSGGVSHEDCANLSREVSTILDVEAVIPGAYVLEVSSPGLDRKLLRPADYVRFTGSLVKLRTRQPVEGSHHFEGRLESFVEGRLTLETSKPAYARDRKPGTPAPSRKVEIELANIDTANLVPEF
jgi:ribosome maturation factor RimP